MRSIWLAAIATVLCLVIAYPLAYILSRKTGSQQRTMLMLVMLPTWMNFLLRTYAWMTLLEKNGIINRLLGFIGLGPFEMINTQGAVVLGMVYDYLPFMILPLYSIMTKIDNSVIEAAQDLGASTPQILRPGADPPEHAGHHHRYHHGVCTGGLHLYYLPDAGRAAATC